ncbi:MAG: RluA family pseudouridine synthase [Alphaproteobacteria bacterium]|nr:RluA family pseudouridine synthase [Alphaproteobacteria bacterium]
MTQLEHVVPADAPRERLDRYLAENVDGFPTRSWARKAIKRGEVTLNDGAAEPQRFVSPGDVIGLSAERRRPRQRYDLDLEVVYEDDHLAVVNKPAGLPVMVARLKTLEHALPGNLQPSALPDALGWPRPVHRLDVPTSGLVVVAKTSSALVHLGRQFEARTVKKRYRALVLNAPPPMGVIESPVEGRPARSRWRTLHTGPCLWVNEVSRVDLWPETGRRHQLRVHLAELGCPVLGDTLHSRGAPVLKHQGLYLAAVELELNHPEDARRLRVELPEPPKFNSFLSREARRWARHHPTEP